MLPLNKMKKWKRQRVKTVETLTVNTSVDKASLEKRHTQVEEIPGNPQDLEFL